MGVAAIILAAGRSSRMGEQNKLLMEVAGNMLVCHVVEAAFESSVENVIVVTGHDEPAVQDAINNDQVTFVHNDDYISGLASSVRAGISFVPISCTHAMILLGDMPGITARMIDEMIRMISITDANAIGVAAFNGKRGNPVIWPRKYFDRLIKLKGDIGARHLLDEFSSKVIEIELSEAVLLDIDTPADIASFK